MVIALLVLVGAFVSTGVVFLVLAWIVAVGFVLIGQPGATRAPSTGQD